MKTLSTPRGGNHLLSVVIFLLLLSFPVMANAGGLWLPTGSRQAGMDHCSVALSGFWSVENNLAGMAGAGKFSAGLAFHNAYFSPHLGTATLAVVYPSPFGKLGLSLRYFGYPLFHQMKAGLSYARLLGKKIRAGVQLVYLQTGFGDVYGSRSRFTFAIGLQTSVTKNLTLGIYIFNPVSVKPAEASAYEVPAIFRLGMAYFISKSLLVTAEAEKSTFWQPVVLRGGVEYRYKKQFFFRAGVATSGDIFAMGFGWRKNKLQIDLATTMHQSLGFSPQASLVFSF